MKPAFNKHAAGEENLSFYEKMQREYDRAKSEGYYFVMAMAKDANAQTYSVASVSRNVPEDWKLADLDNACFAFHFDGQYPLAILDISKPFEEQLRGGDEPAENYFHRPALNLPAGAQECHDLMEFCMKAADQRKSRFTVIQGGKPEDPSLD